MLTTEKIKNMFLLNKCFIKKIDFDKNKIFKTLEKQKNRFINLQKVQESVFKIYLNKQEILLFAFD